jgi:hypothetical protein
MLFRPSAGKLLASLLWALPGVVALPRVALAQTAPKSALITAVRGNSLSLAIGTADGAKIGQTYRVSRGNVNAKLQITATTENESTAVVIASDTGLIITVGESANFLGEEPLAAPVPVAPTPNQPLPLPPVAPPSTLAPNATSSPKQALITGVAGSSVTLGIGSGDGAVLGAVYALPLEGDIKARMQITSVRANDSLAAVTVIQDGFTPTVGDTTRFVAIEELQVPVAPPVVPTVPTPVVPDTRGTAPVPVDNSPVTNSPVSNNGLNVEPAPISALTGSTATVTSIQGQSVVISAGSAQGARPAVNLPILRAGQVIGLLRLQVVNQNSSTGTVLWRDESLAAISAGDAVGILGAAPGVGIPAIGTPVVEQGKVPATLVKYETGASNEAIPKSDRTYELLAALASNGLITSQRAYIFQDDGARRHNTQEDIVFTKAQIAGFIREAISNYDDSKSSRNRAALSILAKDYQRELVQLGETADTLAPFNEKGVAIGVSGFSRYTLAAGDTDPGTRDPFAESYGQRRSKSGYDTRTNLFGQINPRLSFYGSFDYGNSIRNGNGNVRDIAATPINQPLPNNSLNNLQVRKAYLSYDAGNLLRGLKVNLGRKEFWWGPGQFGTSILGDTAGGLDSLSSVFERGSYRLEGMYAYLGRGPAGKYRSLYAQTVSVKVNNSLRVGTSTSVLTPNQKLDPEYFVVGFTPLSLYLVKGKSRTGDSNDNTLLSGFAEASVAKGARVYGEILIDDLSLKTIPAIENRTGSIVGVSLFTPKDPAKAGFKAEFARLNSYSYLAIPNQAADNGDYYYQFRNSPLGYPVGPLPPTGAGGAETLRFEGYYSPLKRLRVYSGIEFSDINSGDQNVITPTVRGFSRQQVRRIAVSYALSRSFTLTGRGQEIRTDQPNFLRNEPSQTDRYVSLELSRSF